MNQLHAANRAHVEELETWGKQVLAEIARDMYADQIDLLEEVND